MIYANALNSVALLSIEQFLSFWTAASYDKTAVDHRQADGEPSFTRSIRALVTL